MKPDKTGNGKNSGSESNHKEVGKRPYSAPVILSIEPLEAIAAVCEPEDLNFPLLFGKPQGPGCFNPGS